METMVRDIVGLSVLEEVYSPSRTKMEAFSNILLSAPALYMTEYALAQELFSRGVAPDYVLGSSMGSFAAATVAGFLNMEDALTAVLGQAQVFHSHCEEGGMLAVLADPKLYRERMVSDNCELAASDVPSHFVISGSASRLSRVAVYLSGMQIPFQELPVTHAFHSRWIDSAKDAYQRKVSRLPVRASATVPLICCATATRLHALPDNYFWRTARDPIRFGTAIRSIASAGPLHYIDAGPAGSLATSVKHVLPSAKFKVTATLTPYSRDFNNFSKSQFIDSI